MVLPLFGQLFTENRVGLHSLTHYTRPQANYRKRDVYKAKDRRGLLAGINFSFVRSRGGGSEQQQRGEAAQCEQSG